MSDTITQLRYFLKEMFQFNENDLDFGIYKIYNLKRRQIEDFIDGDGDTDLIPIIETILREVSVETLKGDTIELTTFLKKFNQEELAKEPIEKYDDIQMVLNFEKDEEKREILQSKLDQLTQSDGVTDDLRDRIYNHVLGFFQMYYSNGDFGYNDRSRDVYKVPYEADYNGSDTLFHWKHKGSLYIKSATSFNAVIFELDGQRIEYRLETNVQSTDETTARNNNKDDQLKHYRFDRIEHDEATDTHRVVFNFSDSSTPKADIFRAVFEQVFNDDTDLSGYLHYEDKGKQKTVFNDLTKDFDKVQNGQIKGLSALRQRKDQVEKVVKKNRERGVRLLDDDSGQFTDPTLAALYTLDQKLNSFYIGHDADYFIHEDLHGFLTAEKERYVKNYIFDDLQAIYAGKLDNRTIVIAKAFDRTSSRIIEFLSTIEEFQKHLFTKKKKVVENEYCLTLDYVDARHYPAILQNQAQLDEWKTLFDVTVKTEEDLQNHPTLTLDTKFFRKDDGTNPLKDAVLAAIPNLSEALCGLLMNTENYQGLELMQRKYKEKIKTIYIDPPYNTGNDGFIYKDNFVHSSWISMIFNRLEKSKTIIHDRGSIFSQIDYKELNNLRLVQNQLWGSENLVQTISIKTSSPAGFKTVNPGPIDVTEYLLFYTKNKSDFTFKKGYVPSSYDSNYNLVIDNHEDNPIDWKLKPIIEVFYKANNIKNNKEAKEIWGKNWKIIRDNLIGDFALKNAEVIVSKRDPHKPTDNLKVLLKESKKTDSLLVYKRDNFEPLYLYKGGSLSFYSKKIKIIDGKETSTELLTDFWNDISWAGIANEGNVKLKNGKKPERLIERINNISNEKGDYVLDYFAGSGTTIAASIKMGRKGIGIEMGEYFNSHTLIRCKNVLYGEGSGISNNWQWEGYGIFKYQVLEQYEDVLDNLEVYDGKMPEGLPVKYYYLPEQNALDHSLDLYRPFRNQMRYGRAGKLGYLDLVETYNYLAGYFIKTIKPYTVNGKYYRAVETTTGTLVLWRDIDPNEDDSAAVLEIAAKYNDLHTIEVNAEYATLTLDKNHRTEVNGEPITVRLIRKEVFNQ